MPQAVVIVGISLLAVGAVGSVLWLLTASGDRSRQRLQALGPVESGGGQVAAPPGGVRVDSVPMLTQALQSTELWQELQMQLIRADWMLRPSEFIALSAGVGIAGAGLGWLILRSLGQGIVLGGVGAFVPYMLMKGREQRRLKMLTSQIPDALDMLSSSMRSGCALLRAMQVVRSQMHPPIAQEFGRVVDEVQFGLTVDQALTNLVGRTGSYDLELITAAVQTQLTVGGNLAEVFDSIAEMIRERVRLLGELQAATAEGRMSAGILLAMPFVMAFMINILNPGYLQPLFKQPLGLILVGVAVVLMAIGALVMRKLIDIDV